MDEDLEKFLFKCLGALMGLLVVNNVLMAVVIWFLQSRLAE